ncbi:hypothetical protein SNEBB_008443 [Seison nebaliae]|nr:hypothetical protein SNEBB_008443 [Seison nebaliae]
MVLNRINKIYPFLYKSSSLFHRTIHLQSSLMKERLANLKISESARNYIENELKLTNNEYLRILIDSGGCSGFQYKFEIINENERNDDDLLCKLHDNDKRISIIVDEISHDLIKGSLLDYQKEIIRSGFVIDKNPQGATNCSCGVSFSLK